MLAAAPAPAEPAPAECKCSMAISVLGDGCSVCNPELYAEMLADQAADEQEEAIAGLVEALEGMLKVAKMDRVRPHQLIANAEQVLAAHHRQEQQS